MGWTCGIPTVSTRFPQQSWLNVWRSVGFNVARVRALCLAVHGYDPGIENWDQSPFRHNESGSQSMTTLAVAGKGAIVPLVEGHSATMERCATNPTTFSNEERIKE